MKVTIEKGNERDIGWDRGHSFGLCNQLIKSWDGVERERAVDYGAVRACCQPFRDHRPHQSRVPEKPDLEKVNVE